MAGLKDLFFKSSDEEKHVSTSKNGINDLLKNIPSVTPTQPVEANISINIDVDGVKAVADIYGSASLPTDRNIYDVSAFIEGLPQTMDTISKKTSLEKILKAAKFDLVNLVADGQQRTTLLIDYAEQDQQASQSKLDEFHAQIEQKNIEIQELKIKIDEEVERHKVQTNVIGDEVKLLQGLMNYISKE